MYHVHVLGFDDKTTTHKHPSRLYDIRPIIPVWDVGCLYGYTKAPTTAELERERNGKYTI